MAIGTTLFISRHITPLVINSLGGGDTHTHTHKHTYAYRHPHRNNFKKPGVRQLQPTHGWFIYALIMPLLAYIFVKRNICKKGMVAVYFLPQS